MGMPLSNALKDSNESESPWVIERLSLLERLDKKEQLLDSKQQRIELLEETIRHRQFGARSEKHIDQGELFNEAELAGCETEDETPETHIEAVAADKTPAKRGRKPIPPDLPRVPVYLNLSDNEKEGAIDTFYDVVKEELDIIPAKVQVLAYHQEKAVYRDATGERAIKSVPVMLRS